MIQAAGGAASLYWNLGFLAVERTMSKVVHWKVNAASAEKIRSEWLCNKKQAKKKLIREQKQQVRDLKQQKQFSTTSKQRKAAEVKKQLRLRVTLKNLFRMHRMFHQIFHARSSRRNKLD